MPHNTIVHEANRDSIRREQLRRGVLPFNWMADIFEATDLFFATVASFKARAW